MAEETEPVYEDAKAASEKAPDKAPEQAEPDATVVEDLGYLGTKVDQTPNEAYTVAGVVKASKP